MKNVGAIIAVGLAALTIMGLALFSFWPGGSAEPPGAPAPVSDGVAAAAPDLSAVQAAFAAREALIQAQVKELDRELADRQTDYDARVVELAELVATGEAQLAQLSAGELALQGQVDELEKALSERGAFYESQRQQANSQLQNNIQQLQIQLGEAKVKLAEAQAQLGQ